MEKEVKVVDNIPSDNKRPFTAIMVVQRYLPKSVLSRILWTGKVDNLYPLRRHDIYLAVAQGGKRSASGSAIVE